MSDMDKYFHILGLNPEASEEDIKEGYKDLMNVWHPDRFPNDRQLQQKANEKLKEIDIAYEKVMSYTIRKNKEHNVSQKIAHSESQPPPRKPPYGSEEGRPNTKSGKGSSDFQPLPEGTSCQKSHKEDRWINPEKRFKPFFSWPNISFFICYGFGLVISIAKYGDLTPNSFGESLGISILPIIFFVIYNCIKGEAKRIRIISVAVNLLFLFLFLSATVFEVREKLSNTPAQHETSTAFSPPSSISPDVSNPTQRLPKRKTKWSDPILADIDVPRDMIWKFVAKDNEESTFSYDTRYCIRFEDRVRVFTKTVYGDKVIIRKTSEFNGNDGKVAFSLELNQIDCMQQIARRLEVYHYSEKGLCINYSFNESEWISIPPNTVLAVLQKEVCR